MPEAMMNIDSLIAGVFGNAPRMPASAPPPAPGGTEAIATPQFILNLETAAAPATTPAAIPTAEAAPALEAIAPADAQADPLLHLLSSLQAAAAERQSASPPASVSDKADEEPASAAPTAEPLFALISATPPPARSMPPAETAAASTAIPTTPGTGAPARPPLEHRAPEASPSPALTLTASPADSPAGLVAIPAPAAEFKIELPGLLAAVTPAPALVTAAEFRTVSVEASGPPVAQETVDAFTEQVVWQVSQGGKQEARIQLHPAELGAVDVRVRLNHDTAHLTFVIEQPQARAAVQAALPQLAAMFAGQGLQLGDTQVQSQHRGSPQQHPANPGHTPQAGNDPDEPATIPVTVRQRLGLIDHYA